MFRFKLIRLAVPKSIRYLPKGLCLIDENTPRDICEVELTLSKPELAFAALCVVKFVAMARLSLLILTLKDIEPTSNGYN